MRLTKEGNLLIGLTSPAQGGKLEIEAGLAKIGLRAHAGGHNNTNYGGWFSALNGDQNYGVFGGAGSIYGTNYGVAGKACNGINNYAVYGEACSLPNTWAGYFDGKTYCPGGVWTASDATLKTNIQDLTGATNKLLELSPKSYQFDQSIAQLNLPQGLQYGLLAENVETVSPHATMEISTPPITDDNGNIIENSLIFNGVNYQQFIPLLIAGFKEQTLSIAANELQITNLLERLEQTEEVLKEKISDQPGNDFGESYMILHQNSPNPFESETLITYFLSTAGHVRIDIRNQKGELVEVLVNQSMEAGEHKLQWNASNVTSGIYLCTLSRDGKVIARKLIKY